VGTKAKQYTPDYVARAVRLCDSSNRPVSEVARDLGVEYATLYGWMKKAGKTKRRQGGLAPDRWIALLLLASTRLGVKNSGHERMFANERLCVRVAREWVCAWPASGPRVPAYELLVAIVLA
jgi:transposase-like protein